MDKDFDLYVWSWMPWVAVNDDDSQWAVQAAQVLESIWDQTPAEQAPAEATPDVTPETWAEPTAEQAPEATETAPETEVPATEGMNEGGVAETATEWASVDELMKMIDSLNTVSDEAADVNAEIKQAAEEVKTAAPETDNVLQEKIGELIQRLADKEAAEIKMQKTIDVLKSEYEKTLNDKINLEFGTASDSRIAQIVNEDPDVKALIAAKMSSWENAQDKVMEAWKTWWENVSWSNISDLVWEKKSAEVDALAAMGEDTSAGLNEEQEEDMYI